MGLQVPFAHHHLVFFFVTVTIYLPIKLIKQKQNVRIKQWREFQVCFQSSMTSLFMEKEKRKKKQCETITQKCMP